MPLVAAAPTTTFDEFGLDALQLFSESLEHALDGPGAQLAQRLPLMWRQLEAMELQLKRQLPLLREQLRQIERAMREFAPPGPGARQPAAAAPLILV